MITCLQEGLAVKKQAETYMSDLDGRPFPIESVARRTALKAEVSSHYIILSEAEFCKEMGHGHRQKDPKVVGSGY